MNWMAQINPATAVWHGVEAYARSRIADMTAVCVSASASDAEIRAAQARIDELNRLLSVPSMLTATASHHATTQRNGY